MRAKFISSSIEYGFLSSQEIEPLFASGKTAEAFTNSISVAELTAEIKNVPLLSGSSAPVMVTNLPIEAVVIPVRPLTVTTPATTASMLRSAPACPDIGEPKELTSSVRLAF